MHWKNLPFIFILPGVVCLSAFSLSCQRSPTFEGSGKPEKIVVLTRNAPTTYYTNKDGELTGLEYDMVHAFSKDFGIRAEFKVMDSVDEILQGLKRGYGNMAAAGLTVTRERSKNFLSGPVYQKIDQELVCHPDARVQRMEDLAGKDLLVVKSSSYEERLFELKADFPALEWRTTGDLSTEQILHQVWKREVDCTVSDSNIISIHRRFMPEVRVLRSIQEDDPLAWIIPKGEKRLKGLIDEWFSKVEKNGKLSAWKEKYYGHVASFDFYDTKVFFERVEDRLPKYKALLEAAGKEHDIPWKLLAAAAYQESHWNPKATSPTGVRGFMMLTRGTAKSVGVKNRMDPKESITGGTKYLKRMLDRVPDHIPEPDRTWMGLASYNVGYSHLKDARKVAIELNKNPNTWHAVKEALPLLSQRKYYKHLKYGYARGTEPVIYVERIRNYHDLLKPLD